MQPGSSAGYFALRPWGICSSVEFRDALCTCIKSWSSEGWWASRSRKATTVNFDLELSRLGLLLQTRKLFFTNFRGVVWLLNSFSSWRFCAECTKCHVYTWFRYNFFRVCYLALPPPPAFFEESLGTRLYAKPLPLHGTCRCYSLHTVNGETERVLVCVMQNLLSGYNKVRIKWPVDSLLRLLSDFSITQPWRYVCW